MSIKPQITYNAKSDVFFGFPDTGRLRKNENNNHMKLASEAITVMISGLYRNYKQPIAFFLAHNSLGSQGQLILLKKCIQAVKRIGLIPVAMTMDQGSTNIKMLREAGVSKNKPWIVVDGEKVGIFYDAPHLIKSARNALKKTNAVSNGKIASFRHVELLYEVDVNSAIRLAPKLLDKNINLPPFASMNVALATRTLSETCASAIKYYVGTTQLPTEAINTSEFLLLYDRIFDTFNSRERFPDSIGKPLRKPITDESSHFTFLNEALVILNKTYFTKHDCFDEKKALTESKLLRATQRIPHYLRGLSREFFC
ncbi:uncharacterized protein LOC129737836 [Uranotaenia lowii]|uniref:uncharacterized protein LOC129737836 n=1 Tax=Uranotaenia lowii TaxID=190385 RepID=UPI00247A1469|nr:uncharacterized protein LOC129737836 [Uranotaenia lowii]